MDIIGQIRIYNHQISSRLESLRNEDLLEANQELQKQLLKEIAEIAAKTVKCANDVLLLEKSGH